MPAAYDTYDYPAYWKGREYEHGSDIIAIKSFLEKIPSLSSVVEIGAGFGRLVPSFSYRAKKIVLTDPSAKLLNLARKQLKNKNINFLKIKIENIPNKINLNSTDLVVCVRVLHHLENIDKAFLACNKILKNKGYFILEFPNKSHFKARVTEYLRGNFTFASDILPKDLRSPKNIRKETIPFYNYHPDYIVKKLEDSGFEIISKRSVSNVRNQFLKKFFPINLFLAIEAYLQKPLASINFGPSIFLLARKKESI